MTFVQIVSRSAAKKKIVSGSIDLLECCRPRVMNNALAKKRVMNNDSGVVLTLLPENQLVLNLQENTIHAWSQLAVCVAIEINVNGALVTSCPLQDQERDTGNDACMKSYVALTLKIVKKKKYTRCLVIITASNPHVQQIRNKCWFK